MDLFVGDTQLASDGLAMLDALLQHLNPSTIDNRIQAIEELASLSMNANDSVVSFMAKCRRIQQELDGVTVDQLIP